MKGEQDTGRACHERRCVRAVLREFSLQGLWQAGSRKSGLPQGLWSKQRSRFVRCRSCGAEFSERKGTALFGLRLLEQKVLEVFAHLADGCGTRQTARLVGVDKDTVTRLAMRAGSHAVALHDERVRHLTVPQAQFDEKWSFVGKKRRALRPRRSG